MSEKFAKVLIEKLNFKIRFAKSTEAKEALISYRNCIIETMLELGHKNVS